MNLLIFGGQGNAKISDLRRVMKKKEGKELIEELKVSNRMDLVHMINELLNGKMEPLFYEMLSTYISNDIYYRRLMNKNIEINAYSSYSAGIFNIISVYYSISTASMLDFIIKRATLFSKYNGKEHLFLYISNEWEKLLNILKKDCIDFDISIISSPNVGVLSSNLYEVNKMIKISKFNDIEVKFHETNISVPYHSKYLKQFSENYFRLVNELFSLIEENNNENPLIIMESDDLKSEINRQLCGTIHWSFILSNIYNESFNTIFDSSLNEFLYKHLNSSDIANKSECVGNLLWKMK